MVSKQVKMASTGNCFRKVRFEEEERDRVVPGEDMDLTFQLILAILKRTWISLSHTSGFESLLYQV